MIIQASLKNSISPMSCSKAAIVNISTVWGSCAEYNGNGYLAYRMSKVINVSCCIHNKLRFCCYHLLIHRKTSCYVFMAVLDVQNGFCCCFVSKAAMNMSTVIQAIDHRVHGVMSVALHPGWVQTELGGSNASLSPYLSVQGMLSVMAGLTEQDSGLLVDYKGEEIPL